MRQRMAVAVSVAVIGLALALGAPAAEAKKSAAGCTPDMVYNGPGCIDKYEASVWRIPAANTSLINLVKMGLATAADLTAGGATQLGLATGDLAAAGCPGTGNGCVDVYAVSIPGVTPSAFLTWFQAAAAARNSGKRLPSNAEWQAAAFGTPGGNDNFTTTCHTEGLVPGLTATGSRSACVSDVGAFDMVGNVWEWVADWVPLSTICTGWGGFSDDEMCLAGASTTGGPGALIRGGSFDNGPAAGVFAVSGFVTPSNAFDSVGFRAAR